MQIKRKIFPTFCILTICFEWIWMKLSTHYKERNFLYAENTQNESVLTLRKMQNAQKFEQLSKFEVKTLKILQMVHQEISFFWPNQFNTINIMQVYSTFKPSQGVLCWKAVSLFRAPGPETHTWSTLLNQACSSNIWVHD